MGNAWFGRPPFGLGADVERRMFELNQRLLARCFLEGGFDYQPIPAPAFGQNDRVSPLDRESASSYGYHHQDDGTLKDPNTRLYANPAFDAIYDECGQRANTAAFRPTDTLAELSLAATNGIRAQFALFETTSSGQVARDSWASCMSESGYAYQSPRDASLQFAEAPSITPTELRVRMKDLSCDEAVRYTRTRFAWEQQAVEIWTAAHEAEVVALLAEARRVEANLSALEASVTQVSATSTTG